MGRPIANPLAQGFYTVAEASRLIRVGTPQRIYGWLRGYPRRDVGPLLNRDFEPFPGYEELSFLDLIEIRFVEHFREHGVKVQSLREAAKALRQEYETDHPFALDRVHLVADKSDVFVEEIFKDAAKKAEDKKLRSLLTKNYVMYETIKQGLIPGVEFDPKDHLARKWTVLPGTFPEIRIDPRIAYGRPSGPSGIPTTTLYNAWKAENRNAEVVSYWYEIPTREVDDAVLFEEFLNNSDEIRAA